MLPIPRTTLKGFTTRNKGLQDILKSMAIADKILTVEVYAGKVHNTQITLEIDRGDTYPDQDRYISRVQLYNRVALTDAVAGLTVPDSGDVNAIIAALNNQGGDFTTDDLEIVNNVLQAKDQSLGYFNNGIGISIGCTPNAVTALFDNLSPQQNAGTQSFINMELVVGGQTFTQKRNLFVQQSESYITIGEAAFEFLAAHNLEIVGGGGGVGAFAAGELGDLQGGNGSSVGGQPATLRFFRQTNPVDTQYDMFIPFINVNSGDPSYTGLLANGLVIHSCGNQNFPGV